jgi:hypothetical protein
MPKALVNSGNWLAFWRSSNPWPKSFTVALLLRFSHLQTTVSQQGIQPLPRQNKALLRRMKHQSLHITKAL